MSNDPLDREIHAQKMKADWERRAAENARWYIATGWTSDDSAFRASGAQDVALFFQGIEELLRKDATVLDIGCGIGRMDESIAPRVRRLIGLDVSAGMVEQARERMRGTSNAEFIVGTGHDLSGVTDDSIDLVFSHIVFQHMPRLLVQSYAEDVRRVLVKGGNFVFQVPEAIGERPSDPPNDDTFEMRYYDEYEVRAWATRLGYHWRGTARYPIPSAIPPFQQLRVHLQRPW